MREKIHEEMKRLFNPEFINRLDELIFFRRLKKKEVTRIIDLMVDEMTKRLAEHDITVELTDGAKEFLVNHGYDPIYGARPLKRAIQKYIEDPLADEILKGRFTKGSTIKIKMKNRNELTFTDITKSNDDEKGEIPENEEKDSEA
jgi:ATP-dependent Clp protease ATP-binding subunit ClpC